MNKVKQFYQKIKPEKSFAFTVVALLGGFTVGSLLYNYYGDVVVAYIVWGITGVILITHITFDILYGVNK